MNVLAVLNFSCCKQLFFQLLDSLFCQCTSCVYVYVLLTILYYEIQSVCVFVCVCEYVNMSPPE